MEQSLRSQPRSRRRRGVRLLVGAVVAVAALATAACGPKTPEGGYDNIRKPSDGTSPSTTAPPKAKAGGGYPVAYKPQTKCQIDVVLRKRKVECGTISVPENRNEPNGNKLDLQVVKVLSDNPNKPADPIVYLEGGPGGSALGRLGTFTAAFSRLLEDRDLIIMDQRGTGYSRPKISCVYDDERAAQTDGIYEVMTACHTRLAKGEIDFPVFNTVENAADFADLRYALQIPQWNLIGVSYGTRLALQMMADDPAGIRSVVLDSVFPGGVDFFNERPPNAVRAFKAVFDACAADPSCNATNPDLENKLKGIIDKLNARPYQGGTNNPFSEKVAADRLLDGNAFVGILFSLLYDTQVIRVLPAMITAASQGDPIEGLVRFLPYAYSGGPGPDPLQGDGDAPSFADGFFYTVVCSEQTARADRAVMEAFTQPVADSIREAFVRRAETDQRICDEWKVPHSPVAEPTAAIPTLVLAGSFDPITPPAWAQRAQALLPKSRYFEMAGAGHGVYFTNDCTKEMVRVFENDPESLGGPDCPPVVDFTNVPLYLDSDS